MTRADRVDGERVVKHWLAIEREKAGLDADGVDALSSLDALDALLAYKPGAAACFWRARPVEWSRIALSRTEFTRLRVIDGPPGLLWGALSPDGTVMGAAARLHTEDHADLAAETGVDVERVLEFVDALAGGSELAALVLTKRRGRGPPRVADGNHRATAVCLHLLRTGEYRPQDAYLGVGANPVLRPLRRRVPGVLDGLRRAVCGENRPRW